MTSTNHTRSNFDSILHDISNRLSQIEAVLQSVDLPSRRKKYYSTSEVARVLCLSKWYVRRLCALGDIKAKKHPANGRFLVPAEELERIQSRRDIFKDDQQ